MKTIAFCLSALFSTAALAGGADVVCGAMTAERDGILCRTTQIDGLGNTLMIHLIARKGDSEERINRAKAATRQAMDAFMAEGGVFMKMRTTRPDGVEVERTCSRVKGRRIEHCESWGPV